MLTLPNNQSQTLLSPKPKFSDQSTVCQRSGSTSFFVKPDGAGPEQTVVRENFLNKKDYLLTYIAYTVGPGNIWLFPCLVLKNGGVIFVLLYIMIVFTMATPLSFIELSMGQYSGKNAVRVWDMIPAFRGIGFSMCMVSFFTAVIFHVFLTYCLFYTIHTFGHSLPWTECKSTWKDCVENYEETHLDQHCTTQPQVPSNCSCTEDITVNCSAIKRTPAFFYFQHIVLNKLAIGKTDGLGIPSYDMVLLTAVSWTIITLSLLRGIRFTRKVLTITVLALYLGLLMLTVKAATDSGAQTGMHFLFDDKCFSWKHLGNVQMWTDALGQAILSLSTSIGTLFMLASYQSFHNRADRDVILAMTVDTATSLLATLTVYLLLGQASYLAVPNHSHPDIWWDSKLGLVFFVYPTLLAMLPWSHLWSMILFFTFYVFSLHPLFSLFENIMVYLQDDFRIVRRHNVKFRILLAFICFCFNLFLICPGGYPIVGFIHMFGISMSLIVIGLFEVTAVMWGYGFNNFIEDIECILAIKIEFKSVLRFLYVIYLPVSLLIIVIMSIAYYATADSVAYIPFSDDATGLLGIMLCLFTISPIFLWFGLHLCKFCSKKNNRQMAPLQFVKRLMRPMPRWGPNDGSNVKRNVDTVFADVFPSLRLKVPLEAAARRRSYQLHVDDFKKELESFYGPHVTASLTIMRKQSPLPLIPED